MVGQLEEKHVAVSQVPLEYRRDIEETLSRLRKVHGKELENITRQAAKDQSSILTEYERLSKDIMSFRTNITSQNTTKGYPPRRQHLQQCLDKAKDKLASKQN